MRPIDRGAIPLSVNGVPKSVTDYKNWRQDLIDVLGHYCCYCNMPLHDSPQVEHVTPKSPQLGQIAGSMTAWDNMLLACGPCNRAKSNHPNSPATHYMPDVHNTHLAFDYVVIERQGQRKKPACIPKPKAIPGVNATKALRTIQLCDLDSIKSSEKASDLRWHYRFEAHAVAGVWKNEWEQWGKDKADRFIPLLQTVAAAKGFFSIWFEVFKQDAAVKAAIIAAFPGTATVCFDAANDYDPIPRVLGDL